MKFKEISLGELCEIKSSKRIYAKEYKKTGVPFYRSKEIIQKANNENVSIDLYISEERYKEIKGKFGTPTKGDILLTSVGTIGVSYLVGNEKFYFKDGNLTWFSNFSDQLNNEFLYYWFNSKMGKNEINRITIGSTQKALTIVNLKNLKISLPTIEIQIKIVHILKSLNEKIKSNLNLLSKLEELSQTLFKHWFINFEFPNEEGKPYKSSGGEMVESELGEIPEGWQIDLIANLSKQVSKGTTPRKKDLESCEEEINYVPFLKVKDIKDDGTINWDNLEVVPKKIHENQLKRSRLQKYDLLISIAGTIGRVSYVPSNIENLNINQAIAFVRLKEFKHFYFIQEYFKTNIFKEYLNRNIVQAVQANVSLTNIKEFKLLMPNDLLLEYWNEKIQSIFSKIELCKIENKNLTQLRDTLLPKLLSGEIEIPDNLEVE